MGMKDISFGHDLRARSSENTEEYNTAERLHSGGVATTTTASGQRQKTTDHPQIQTTPGSEGKAGWSAASLYRKPCRRATGIVARTWSGISSC